MDDVSWSEPTPQRRRAPELAPPEWMQPPDPRSGRRSRAFEPEDAPAASHRADDGFDADLGATVDRWHAEMALEPVIEYSGELDEEAVWGPRPKLMPGEPGGRRTVVITGRVADRYVAPRTGARDSLPRHARQGFAADRTAMWAVLLCVILLLVAVTSH